VEPVGREPLTLDEIDGPLRSVYAAVLARAVRDVEVFPFGVKPGLAHRTRCEAYDWLMSPDALAYCQVAGVPVELFKRRRAKLADPRTRRGAAA
jgi:hypothetical protein